VLIQLKGNILDSMAHALVNPVNCGGIMGKGLALQFRRTYPRMYQDYQRVCLAGLLQPGSLHVFPVGARYIINFPTKIHWSGKSKLEFIDAGLQTLVEEILLRDIHSIAVPPLGCGLGGLMWKDVFPLIKKYLGPLPTEVQVYAPETPETPTRS
jgi:O-acetyl-ADP-ribose deacetylase (regulator of RNase III)